MYHDVAIAGGSIAGLLCAREVAAAGHSVVVIEEGSEVGTPEHCGGLVSAAGLEELGIIPFGRTLNHAMESARMFAPDGSSFALDARSQRVLGISRRELDKQAAHQAQKHGARIMAGTRYRGAEDGTVRTSAGEIKCRVMVNATGVQSLARKDSGGIMPSAQYEIYADWIKKGAIEVHLDQERFPGFFGWVIPSGHGRGRVGAAGRGINPAESLDRFLAARGGHSVIRKIHAPIWVNGPIDEFVVGTTVTIGDAAGQAKPTTGGGIFSGGMGGLLAGRAIARFLDTGRESDLREYQASWMRMFGKEFERQSRARRILEKVDNDTINRLCGAITPDMLERISGADDFDFHAGSIARLLGAGGSVKAAHAMIRWELKRILS